MHTSAPGPEKTPPRPITEPEGLIVIGASRGGLDAISTLVQKLPAELSAAVAAVLHTSADSPRVLASVVGAKTALPVYYATQDTHIRAGHIYFAPPAYHLIVAAPGLLGLEVSPKLRNSRPAADRLFETAAAVYGSRVIGVVLTGGDGDGTAGLRAIKAAGGIGVVQDPDQALDPGMPKSALQGDHPDYCVGLDEMAALLITLSQRLHLRSVPSSG